MGGLPYMAIQPAARPIVEAARAVYLSHLRPWVLGMVLHGSALKGGFIGGCSDVDMQLYLKEEAFTAEGLLPLEVCIALHADLARIDPAPFQYIQAAAYPPRLPAGMAGPIPGAYHVLSGRLPVPEATEEALQASAREALARLQPVPAYVPRALLEHGGGKLERAVRLLCTDVWPTLFQVVSVQQREALCVWALAKEQAIALLPPDAALAQAIRGFYASVRAYYANGQAMLLGLEALQSGVVFLQATRRWWEEVEVG